MRQGRGSLRAACEALSSETHGERRDMLCATKMSLALLVVCSSAAFADDETPPVVGGKTYVQHQILTAKRLHPEIVDITVVGKRPEDKLPVALGSTASARDVFKPAPELSDGSSVAGRYFIVREPFVSSTGHRLGTIEIRFPSA